MVFENIVGNKENKELLKNMIKSGNISHGIIFEGKESIGKSLFGINFAKSILCTSENEKPCNKCKSCIEIDNLNNPDFLLIEPEENSLKIEQIREMNKKVLEKPIVSNRKVYIINDSEKMTKEAQNSLLKTLEEPPEYITIILISSNDNMFLNTIKSRCVKITFDKLSNEELKEVLQEKLDISGVSEEILKIADGSVNKVITLKEKEDIYIKIKKAFTNLENTNKIDMINLKETLFKEKEDIADILEYINIIFFDLANKNQKYQYLKCMEIIEDTKARLSRNSNIDMTIDRMLIKTWEEVNNG
jgi:DNA polymerase-3 subunit delta'